MDKIEQIQKAYCAYADGKPRPKGVSRKVWKWTPRKAAPPAPKTAPSAEVK